MRKFFVSLAILLSAAGPAHAQFYSIHTNLLQDAILNMNLELSATVNRRWSLHLPVTYNPFIYNSSVAENRKLRNLTFMPGARWWTKESYNGGFVGIYGVATRYDVAHIFDKYRYDGFGVGAGVSIGYAHPLSRRWNFEVEIGAGVLYHETDKYRCKRCGRFEETLNGLAVVPLKAGAGLVYLF